MTSATSIEVQGVHKQYGEKVVLNDITLAVPNAQIFGLLGPSGSGKTTLVRMIAGIDAPTQDRSVYRSRRCHS